MKTKLIAIAVTAALVSACSSAPQKTAAPVNTAPQVVTTASVISTIPEWARVPVPNTDEHMFVVGTATSRDLSMSQHKAVLEAQSKIAEHIRADIDSIMKDHSQDVNGSFNSNTERLVRKIVNEVQLSRGAIVKQEVYPEGAQFRTYVLLRYPAPNINRAISAVNKYEGPTSRERALEQELNQHKERAARAEKEAAAVTPVPDNSGISIRYTEAGKRDDGREEN